MGIMSDLLADHTIVKVGLGQIVASSITFQAYPSKLCDFRVAGVSRRGERHQVATAGF